MVWDFYDGPRTGIADFEGRPHYFTCGWDVEGDDYGYLFALVPIDAETFALAQEQWSLWCEWERAYYAGKVTQESHPGHGGHDSRYDELEALLDARIEALADTGIRARGEFERDSDGAKDPAGAPTPLVVHWTSAPGADYHTPPPWVVGDDHGSEP
jgi:hypothetical protein